MESLEAVDALAVQQVKEWGEILTDFETRNRYKVVDSSGREMFFAGEEGGSWLARVFLKAWRPFTLRVVEGTDTRLVVRRPFRFYFHVAEIFDGAGNRLGALERQFSLFQRNYVVRDDDGRERYELFGPFFRPWTFRIMEAGREVGKITKRWSGLLKETFSDADNFGVEFPPGVDSQTKAILLGAVFLIDFAHFEDRD